jgi:hypothetical protein
MLRPHPCSACRVTQPSPIGVASLGDRGCWGNVDTSGFRTMIPIGYIGIPVALLGAFLLSLDSSVQQRGVADVGDSRTVRAR